MLLVLLSAGCGQAVVAKASHVSGSAASTRKTHRVVHDGPTTTSDCPAPSVVGSGPDAQLLESIVAHFTTCLQSLQVLDTPPTGDPANATSPGWLIATFSTDLSFPDQAVAQWGADMIAGDYNTRCAGSQAICIGGVSTQGSGDGPVSNAASSTIVTQDIPQPVSSEPVITSAITANAASLDVTVESVSFDQLDGLVPIVVVQAPSDAAAVAFQKGALFGSLSLVGSLIEVEDSDGTPLVIDGTSPRTQSFAGWVAP